METPRLSRAQQWSRASDVHLSPLPQHTLPPATTHHLSSLDSKQRAVLHFCTRLCCPQGSLCYSNLLSVVTLVWSILGNELFEPSCKRGTAIGAFGFCDAQTGPATGIGSLFIMCWNFSIFEKRVCYTTVTCYSLCIVFCVFFTVCAHCRTPVPSETKPNTLRLICRCQVSLGISKWYVWNIRVSCEVRMLCVIFSKYSSWQWSILEK